MTIAEISGIQITRRSRRTRIKLFFEKNLVLIIQMI